MKNEERILNAKKVTCVMIQSVILQWRNRLFDKTNKNDYKIVNPLYNMEI